MLRGDVGIASRRAGGKSNIYFLPANVRSTPVPFSLAKSPQPSLAPQLSRSPTENKCSLLPYNWVNISARIIQLRQLWPLSRGHFPG